MSPNKGSRVAKRAQGGNRGSAGRGSGRGRRGAATNTKVLPVRYPLPSLPPPPPPHLFLTDTQHQPPTPTTSALSLEARLALLNSVDPATTQLREFMVDPSESMMPSGHSSSDATGAVD